MPGSGMHSGSKLAPNFCVVMRVKTRIKDKIQRYVRSTAEIEIKSCNSDYERHKQFIQTTPVVTSLKLESFSVQ